MNVAVTRLANFIMSFSQGNSLIFPLCLPRGTMRQNHKLKNISNADISIDGLSTQQKISLMERIWSDLSQRPEELPTPAWHGDILERRRQSDLSGEKDFENWDDVKKRLLSRFE